MPHYRFTAIDDRGGRHSGYREAANESALSTLLRREGHWLAEARESRSPFRTPSFRFRFRRVPQRVLEQFFFSLSLQLSAGVDLVAALTFGLQSDAPASFRTVHANILQRVKAGVPLSEAMALHPRAFSVVVINLVRAGEACGRLGEVCDEIRHLFEWQSRLLGDVKQALIYPITLLLATISFFFVVFTFFIPRFSLVLRELGTPLPWLTRVMIQVSDTLKHHFILAGLALILPPLAVAVGCRISARFAQGFDGLKLRLPFVGPILWQTCLCRLTHNLATLYQSGISLLEALRLCEPLVGNRLLRASLKTVQEGIAAGRTLHETLSQSALFPPMVVQMTALGETTGTLDQSLKNVARYYDLMVPRAVKQLFLMFEPLMIFGLLLVVGTIVLSMFLPIAASFDLR